MSNSYFSFKQFTIHQQHCAMKVCTDACLFGAWAARAFTKYQPGAQRMLDIGTGTGLLSLLVTQQIPHLVIDAIEVDPAAAAQAVENVAASPFKNISVITTPVQEHTALPYDLVICNPPFYESDLRSPNPLRNAAMHDSELTLEQLVNQFSRLLTNVGLVAVLVPFARRQHLQELSLKQGFFLSEAVQVKQTARHEPFRSMMLFSKREEAQPKETVMAIHDELRQYTLEFTNYLQPYYLSL